jgi:hypothetical protein
MKIHEIITERKSEYDVLKANKIALSADERETVISAGAVWHNGPGGKEVPSIWKTKDGKGNTKYVCNTHRCYQVRNTLKSAIKAYDFVKTTS